MLFQHKTIIKKAEYAIRVRMKATRVHTRTHFKQTNLFEVYLTFFVRNLKWFQTTCLFCHFDL